jgi:hypothetical protein
MRWNVESDYWESYPIPLSEASIFQSLWQQSRGKSGYHSSCLNPTEVSDLMTPRGASHFNCPCDWNDKMLLSRWLNVAACLPIVGHSIMLATTNQVATKESTQPTELKQTVMDLGSFSVKLTVKDIPVSKEFYEKRVFKSIGGNI